MKFISNIFYQIYATFSEQPSFLSSKKIERFIVFMCMLPISIIYIIKNIKTLDAPNFMIVVGGWLSYSAYNTIMNFKDKQLKTNTNDTNTNTPQS